MRKFTTIITISFLILSAFNSNGAVYTSVGHGNWETDGTWDLSGHPDNNDTVIIRAIDTVVITNPNLDYSGTLLIFIDGGLDFNGGKLVLPNGSTIVIANGGWIFSSSGKPNNDKIRINNTGLWTGNDGPLGGYTVLGTPLPLQANSIELNINYSSNSLTWNVLNTKDINYFVLEKSLNGTEYFEIEKISNNGSNSYTKFVNTNSNQVDYYRVKVVYFTDQYEYSSAVAVNNRMENQFNIVNPSTNNAIQYSLKTKENITVTLFDLSGKLALKTEMDYTSNSLNHNLLHGNYILQYELNGQIFQQKIRIQ